jgi:hypothetical protein
MATTLMAVLTLVAMAAVVVLPLRRAFAVTVGIFLLVPSSLVLPNPLSPAFTVTRLVLLAFVVGLARRTRRGELDADVWRPGLVHVLAAGYLTIALIDGVALAPGTVVVTTACLDWLDTADQMVCLLAGLAVFRHLQRHGGLGFVLRVLGAALTASVVIGIGEHMTGGSWSHLLFSSQKSQQSADAARDLITRDGERRIRAAAQYAIEYGWVCAMLIPALLAGILSWRRVGRISRSFLAIPAAGLVVLAIFWSFTRTAVPAAALGLVVLAIASRDRRFVVVAVGALALGGLAIVADPHLLTLFSASADQGSIDVRAQRLPLVWQAVSAHPVTGLGYSGLEYYDVTTTDLTWLLTYAELGVLGLGALIALLGVVFGRCLRGLAATDRDTRLVCAVAVASLAVVVAGGFAYDSLTVLSTSRLVWLLAAVGLAGAETVPQREAARRSPSRWVRVPAALAAAGITAAIATAALGFWPRTTIIHTQFEALAPSEESGNYDNVDEGRQLISSSCTIARGLPHQGLGVDCRDANAGAGVGLLTVTGHDRRRAAEYIYNLTPTIRGDGLRSFRFLSVEPPVQEVPALLKAAPIVAPIGVAAAALMLPVSIPLATRRRPREGNSAAPPARLSKAGV